MWPHLLKKSLMENFIFLQCNLSMINLMLIYPQLLDSNTIKNNCMKCKPYQVHCKNIYQTIPWTQKCNLNVHKTFQRRPERLLNILCTLNLRPMYRGILVNIFSFKEMVYQSEAYFGLFYQTEAYFEPYQISMMELFEKQFIVFNSKLFSQTATSKAFDRIKNTTLIKGIYLGLNYQYFLTANFPFPLKLFFFVRKLLLFF